MIGIAICFVAMLILQIFTPFWWWILVVPFAGAIFLCDSAKEGFKVGFIAAGLLWLLAGLFFYINGADVIFGRTATLLRMPVSWLLFIFTAVIAGLAGGVGGLGGYWAGAAFSNKGSS